MLQLIFAILRLGVNEQPLYLYVLLVAFSGGQREIEVFLLNHSEFFGQLPDSRLQPTGFCHLLEGTTLLGLNAFVAGDVGLQILDFLLGLLELVFEVVRVMVITVSCIGRSLLQLLDFLIALCD